MPGEEEGKRDPQLEEEEITLPEIPENDDNVTLPKNVYETLLAQIAEGTEASKKILSKVETEEEEINKQKEDELRKQRLGRYETAQNPTELAKMIKEDVMGEVQELILPMATTVMSMVVAEEVKEVKKNYNDFDKYTNKIFDLTSNNSKLSIEDAYLIASGKASKTEVAKKGENKNQEKDKPVIGGEKPGPGKQQMDNGPARSLKDAVRMASKKVLGNLD